MLIDFLASFLSTFVAYASEASNIYFFLAKIFEFLRQKSSSCTLQFSSIFSAKIKMFIEKVRKV